MTRIVVDIGNTRVKWGRVGADGRLGNVVALPLDDPDSWARAWDAWGLSEVGFVWEIASVNPPAAARLGSFLEKRGVSAVQIHWVRSAAEVGIRHDVEGADSGGADRALVVLGALARRCGRGPGLVIMCGTAVTVERISADGVWEGGSIAPGLGPMARALHLLTAQLPEARPTGPPAPFGRSTVPSLEAGVFWSVVGGIREIATRQAEGLSPAPWLIWTGGDSALFSPFVSWPGSEVVPNLVLEGLILAGATRGGGA